MANKQKAQSQEISQKKKNLGPIKLEKTSNDIWRKGYYIGRITDADDLVQDGKRMQTVDFEVAKGKYEGFKLSTKFYESYKSRLRFSHLCASVGITEQLNSIDQLIGKLVKLRVVPTYRNYMGKRYLNHEITRFHPVN